MPDEHKREELTDEEVDAQIGAALPEVSSILPIPDPTASQAAPDPTPKPEEGKAGGKAQPG
jgi:hypothetical protein